MKNYNILEGPLSKLAPPHLMRQILASFASFNIFIAGGIDFGYTAVMLPSLAKDEEFPYDKNLDSWIASMAPLAMLCGCLFSGALSDTAGRRKGMIVLIIPFTIGWLLMGFGTNNTYLLIARFITGCCSGSFRASAMVYVGELTDPKYRATALFTITSGVYVGALFCHVIGQFVYWRYSCIVFTIPGIISLAILMMLKESPLWLISKGRIDDGIVSFKEFRGDGESSDKELNNALAKLRDKTDEYTFKDLLNVIFSKPFCKSILTILSLFLAMQWSGVNMLMFYAQDIFDHTFSGEIDSYILMIATDCIKVLVSVIVSSTANLIPRKLGFVSSCFSITFILGCLVTYLYLKPSGLSGIAVALIVIYIALSSVIQNIAWSFVAEIFPSHLRGFGSGLSSAISFVLLFISVKVTPQVISNFGIEIMYICFAVIVFIAGFSLIFILPDTNKRSLQDIEESLYQNKMKDTEDISTTEISRL